MLGIKPRALCMPVKHPTTELHPQPCWWEFDSPWFGGNLPCWWQWCLPVIPALGRPRQKDHAFKASHSQKVKEKLTEASVSFFLWSLWTWFCPLKHMCTVVRSAYLETTVAHASRSLLQKYITYEDIALAQNLTSWASWMNCYRPSVPVLCTLWALAAAFFTWPLRLHKGSCLLGGNLTYSSSS